MFISKVARGYIKIGVSRECGHTYYWNCGGLIDIFVE